METITFKYKPWVQKLLHHMPAFSWVIWKKQLLLLVPLRPHMKLRFTDDKDIQWNHGRKDLHEFLDKAYAFYKTIKFTSKISNDDHVFLDT